MKENIEKILFQETWASWEQMLDMTKKAEFPIKRIHLYNLWYLATLKTPSTRDGVILTLSFPDNINFLEKLSFNRNPFLYLPSKECFILKKTLTLSKTIECLSMSLVTNTKKKAFLWFTYWGCFWCIPISSSLLWLVPNRHTFYKPKRCRMFWHANLLKINFIKICISCICSDLRLYIYF